MKTVTFTCDICGSETLSKVSWEVRTVEIRAVIPIDGINGGDFSGDWCRTCRYKVNQFIESLKAHGGAK